MIKMYKSVENRIQQIYEIEKKCWINITEPELGELKKISENFHIPFDFLTDSLDVHERARVETEENCTLIVFRAPVFQLNNPDVPYSTFPVGIIITVDFIVTVSGIDVEQVLDLCSAKIRHFSPENRNQFVIHLLHRASFYYLKYLEELDARTNKVETELQKATKNEELIKLLNIEKSLVFFTTSLKSNMLMMERLIKQKHLMLSDPDLDFLDDAKVDHLQAIEMAEIYSNILSGMMDAFASVISNNLNIVMKFLTGITLLIMIPTLISSIYGMNIKLPFQTSPYAFLLIMCSSVVFSVIGIWIFLKNRWI